MLNMTRRSALLMILFIACSTGRDGAGDVDLARWLDADSEPDQWMSLGRNWQAQRFSQLEEITHENVDDVGFAWEYEARSRRGRVEHGQEATPIVVDGVLYASGPWGSVFAVDARTGEERWRYDPDVDGSYNRRACCDVVNRGAAVWRGRVYVATLDGSLLALDAATGDELWKADTIEDRSRFYTITSPPQIAGDVVVIGNSGADFGVRGYVTAYDLESGRQRWRFYVVPRDPAKGPPENASMERALDTWGPDTDWESGLGGTVWGEMTYDPELDLLYVGTGNSSPYSGWHRDPSQGDNLFLASILALDPDDGRLVWHYQQVPWENWDYNASSNMILADLEIDGRMRQVLMQAPKNGIFYLLDRKTGEFISGDPFVFINWTKGLDAEGRPTPNPAATDREKPALVFPSSNGAHSWEPMAYSPATELVYIPTQEEGMVLVQAAQYSWQAGAWNFGNFSILLESLDFLDDATRALYVETLAANPDLPDASVQEFLMAWDPVAKNERWRVPLGASGYQAGGVLTTAGNLVIQGRGSGELSFYRADTGELLRHIDVGTGIMAAPISYAIDGEQYVAVLAGGAAFSGPLAARNRYENYGRMLAFKLGGGPTPLPPVREPTPTPEPPADFVVDDAAADRGAGLYLTWCAACHLGSPEAPSAYPDLFALRPETHDAFESILLGGILSDVGMASFADVLTPDDAASIQAHLVRSQRERVRKESSEAPER
jgi:quinohemoprotein ethanol dehydrogenase